MRILVVSWFFPPANTIGALRVGRMVQYLLDQGHDVRVLTARDLPHLQTMPLDIPEERVVRSRWLDLNAAPKAAARLRNALRDRLRGKPGAQPGNSGNGNGNTTMLAPARKGAVGRAISALGALYGDVLNFPDAAAAWIFFGWRDGTRFLKIWKPDAIFATGPMFSGLVIGHLLARRHNVPWVAELRDRWSDDPYSTPASWRARLTSALERCILRGTAGIGTVSEPWAHVYRATYGKPTLVMYNGYDPADFSEPGAGSPETPKLRIVHTGHIYTGRRDPTALFKAVRLLGPEAEQISMLFLGAKESDVVPLAQAEGVAERLEPCRQVPYVEALKEQARADILLLMQWNNPREQGNVPGKLFEYLAIRRPILGLGIEDGVPATIIAERGAGLYCNDPEQIAAHLRQWIAEKRSAGRIAALPDSVSEGLTRDRQFAKLPVFLDEILKGG
jgi:glycosyltransferase involved in cell wall biosynthesis